MSKIWGNLEKVVEIMRKFFRKSGRNFKLFWEKFNKVLKKILPAEVLK